MVPKGVLDILSGWYEFSRVLQVVARVFLMVSRKLLWGSGWLICVDSRALLSYSRWWLKC